MLVTDCVSQETSIITNQMILFKLWHSVQSKSGGKGKLASFDDELTLFSGKQDLNTIARADYKASGHDKVGVFRHKPKDQIEVSTAVIVVGVGWS